MGRVKGQGSRVKKKGEGRKGSRVSGVGPRGTGAEKKPVLSKEEKEARALGKARELLQTSGFVVMQSMELDAFREELRREEFLAEFREMRDESAFDEEGNEVRRPKWDGRLFDKWKSRMAEAVAGGESWALKWYGEQMIGKPGTKFEFSIRSPEVMEMAVASARDVLTELSKVVCAGCSARFGASVLQRIIDKFQEKMVAKAAQIEGRKAL